MLEHVFEVLTTFIVGVASAGGYWSVLLLMAIVWLTFVGSLPWCCALAYAGVVLAERWQHVREARHGLEMAVAAVVGLGIAAAVWHRVRPIRAHARRHPAAV